MRIRLVEGEPALILDINGERALVVADLHLGVEKELAESGISLPSQMPKVRQKLLELLEVEKPDRLIFLGDVKHNVPVASWQEWRELPGLFAELSKLARIEILPGNHDGDIRGMIAGDVVIREAGGMVMGRAGLLHGHAWPKAELLRAGLLVMGHNHPAVELRGELGNRATERVWLRCRLDRSKFPAGLREGFGKEPPELLVMPAFSEVVGRSVINRAMPEELLGPIFKAGAARVEEAEVYMLDGTFLGTVEALRSSGFIGKI